MSVYGFIQTFVESIWKCMLYCRYLWLKSLLVEVVIVSLLVCNCVWVFVRAVSVKPFSRFACVGGDEWFFFSFVLFCCLLPFEFIYIMFSSLIYELQFVLFKYTQCIIVIIISYSFWLNCLTINMIFFVVSFARPYTFTIQSDQFAFC